MLVHVCKIFRFEAAHKLDNHSGKCRNLHGHSYRLEVEVVGGMGLTPGVSTFGMVYDFGDLSRIVREEIIDRLDHSYLNDHFVPPTAEVMTQEIFRTLQLELPVQLYRVRLYETETSYAEIFSQ